MRTRERNHAGGCRQILIPCEQYTYLLNHLFRKGPLSLAQRDGAELVPTKSRRLRVVVRSIIVKVSQSVEAK